MITCTVDCEFGKNVQEIVPCGLLSTDKLKLFMVSLCTNKCSTLFDYLRDHTHL